ncbi:hypothetical protein HYW94_00195 [Candidatus Uhrbacteria bacterium]|nr:hypothetical protein [Candidatus Uhrbacteria bacterium]
MEFVIAVSIYLLLLAVWAFLSMMTLFMMMRYQGFSLLTWIASILYLLMSAGALLVTMNLVSRLEVDWTSLLYFFQASL